MTPEALELSINQSAICRRYLLLQGVNKCYLVELILFLLAIPHKIIFYIAKRNNDFCKLEKLLEG